MIFFFLVLRWTAPNRAMVDDAVYGSQNNAIPVLIVWDCLPIYFFFWYYGGRPRAWPSGGPRTRSPGQRK